MTGKLLGAFRSDLVRSLNFKVFLLVTAALAGIVIAAVYSLSGQSQQAAMAVGGPLAETQALYDRDRGEEVLVRDVELARALSGSGAVIDWASDEATQEKRDRALGELDQLRKAFRDGSYFIALNGSGNYYYNDEDGSFTGDELRYTIDPENPRDEWYYRTLAGEPGCYMNVDNRGDATAKLWVNCLITKDGQSLGVLGTGVDIATFFDALKGAAQQGVTSSFLDAAGVMQARRVPGQDTFALASGADKTPFFDRLDNDDARSTLKSMMQEAKATGLAPATVLRMSGHDMLVSVGYLEGLNWFNVARVDLTELAGQSVSRPLGILLGLAFAAAALIALMFKFFVADRVARAERAVAEVAAGNHDIVVKEGKGEIGSLMRSVNTMAASVREKTGLLESQLREHREKMENGAYFDGLTGLVNRRGLIETFRHRRPLVERKGRLGLLILDIDHIKPINEGFGNDFGDAVIAEVGRRLDGVTRRLDICGRWSGDEFAVLVDHCTPQLLTQISTKVLDAVRAKPFQHEGHQALRVSISIGACMIDQGEMFERAVYRADEALEMAKSSGRNCCVVHEDLEDAHEEDHDTEVARVA